MQIFWGQERAVVHILPINEFYGGFNTLAKPILISPIFGVFSVFIFFLSKMQLLYQLLLYSDLPRVFIRHERQIECTAIHKSKCDGENWNRNGTFLQVLTYHSSAWICLRDWTSLSDHPATLWVIRPANSAWLKKYNYTGSKEVPSQQQFSLLFPRSFPLCLDISVHNLFTEGLLLQEDKGRTNASADFCWAARRLY